MDSVSIFKVPDIWEDDSGTGFCHCFLSTTDSAGHRASASQWLQAAASVPGAGTLDVMASVIVERMLFEKSSTPLRPCGLLLRDACNSSIRGVLQLPGNRSEVILCAGAIETPRILISSGLKRTLSFMPVITVQSSSPKQPDTVGTVDKTSHVIKHLSFSDSIRSGLVAACPTEDDNKKDTTEYKCASGSEISLIPHIGENLQDHILLPMFYLNLSNIVLIIANFFILIFNMLIKPIGLSITYHKLSRKSTETLCMICL